MKPKILFFGTPHFAAELLSYLAKQDVSIVGIVTQPDRPKGRSLSVQSSEVKQFAEKFLPSIPIFQPEKSSDPLFLEQIALLKADLYVVVSFGQILPQKLLDIPPLGCINVHPSLLPKYRGASPIRRALMNGETQTGVVIQKMVKQLDAGDVLAVIECDIPPDMIFGDLEKYLCEQSKPLLLSVIHSFEKGIPPANPQDPNAVTYAHKIEPEDGHIDWNQPASSIHNLVRALSPKPGAWVWIELNGEKKRLKILRTQVHSTQGSVGKLTEQGTVFCKIDSIQLLEVQPEGKRPMRAQDWLRGLKSLPIFVNNL